MTELDLLNLARAATQDEVTWFTQMITISFAMVVAVYYFLHQADLRTRIAAFAAYIVGMLIFWGEMLIESNLKYATMAALKAMPHLGPVSQEYVGVNSSWLGNTVGIVFSASFWVLWGSIFYLVFFWKKTGRAQAAE
jgi:hypothetical protein